MNKISKNSEIKSIIIKFIKIIFPALFFVSVYLIHGNLDKENYGTTIFQINTELGMKSYFLGYPVFDFGINLGSELPILSFWNISPIQIASNLLGIVITWFALVFISITFLNLQVNKLLDVTVNNLKYKYLLSSIFVIASPLMIDSFTANDWPATWLSQVVTMTIWVIVLTDFNKIAQETIVFNRIGLVSFLFLIVVASDPGYILIVLGGIFVILLINFANLKKILYFNNYSILEILIFILSWVSIIVIVFQLQVYSKNFDTLKRHFSSASESEYKEYFNFDKLFEAIPRSSHHLMPILIILVLVYFILIFLKKLPKDFILKLGVLLFFSFGFLLISNLEVTSGEYLTPLPTANFFFRDVAYFLILTFVITLISSQDNFYKIDLKILLTFCLLLVFLLLPNLVYIFSSFGNMKYNNGNSWVKSNIKHEGDKFIDTFILPKNAGIAFTSKAYDDVRSNPQNSFWMPTDLTKNGNRLLTLITKMQFERKFNQADYLFQANSLIYPSNFWCSLENRKLYWVEISVHHYREESCSNSIKFRIGNLELETFGKTNNSEKIDSDRNVFKYSREELFLILSSDSFKNSKFNLLIPIKFNDRIKYESSALSIISERDKTGLTNLNFTSANQLPNYNVKISYDPPFLIKLLAFTTHLTLIVFFVQILIKFNQHFLSRNLCARRDLNP